MPMVIPELRSLDSKNLFEYVVEHRHWFTIDNYVCFPDLSLLAGIQTTSLAHIVVFFVTNDDAGRNSSLSDCQV